MKRGKETLPRRAIILAALSGWPGDDPSGWPRPNSKRMILDWAEAHMGCAEFPKLGEAFAVLETEGLFFRIRHGCFSEAQYYCSFNSRFLQELPGHKAMRACDGQPIIEFWDSMVTEFNIDYGNAWRKSGLCWGQGSQSGGSPWGPCEGTKCCWFKGGKAECAQGLEFKI